MLRERARAKNILYNLANIPGYLLWNNYCFYYSLMVILNFQPIIHYIIEHQPAATPAAICGFLEQTAHNPNNNLCPFEDERFEWEVELPPVPNVTPVRN